MTHNDIFRKFKLLLLTITYYHALKSTIIMARLSYKQTVLNSFRNYLQCQIIRERLLSLWKDSGFLALEFETDSSENMQNDNYPENFEFYLDTFASPETLRFQEFEFFQMLLQIIPTIRYLAPRNTLPKSSDFVTRLIFELPENRFM